MCIGHSRMLLLLMRISHTGTIQQVLLLLLLHRRRG